MGEKLKRVLGEPADAGPGTSQETIRSEVHSSTNENEQIRSDAGETMAEYAVKDRLI